MKLLAPERPRLESLAYRLLDDGADVADVLQDVYLSAYRSLPKYRGDARLATWLYRITFNACLRFRARRPETADAEVDQERFSPDDAVSVALRLDLAAPRCRRPVGLVLMINNNSFDSTADEALAIPLGTVGSRLAAARAKLRAMLSPDQERDAE